MLDTLLPVLVLTLSWPLHDVHNPISLERGVCCLRRHLLTICIFIRAVPAGYGFVVGWCFVMAFFSLMCGLVMQGFTSTVEGKLTAGAQDSRRMMTAGGAESSAVRHAPAQAAAVLQAGSARHAWVACGASQQLEGPSCRKSWLL
jgi:hypothetical protein